MPPTASSSSASAWAAGWRRRWRRTCATRARPPAGLLLRSTFDSLTNAAAGRFPWLPVGLLLKDRFESSAAADRVTCPVFQAHGTADGIVPAELGRRLFEAFPESSADGVPKRWLAIDGAGHNAVRLEGGAAYAAAERAFLGSL